LNACNSGSIQDRTVGNESENVFQRQLHPFWGANKIF